MKGYDNMNNTMVKTISMTDLNNWLDEAKQQLINLGYSELSNNSYHIELNNRFTNRLGDCSRIKQFNYRIRLNQKRLQYDTKKDVQNTIMHELIHSINGCMNHRTKFQNVARHVNSSYSQYHIATHSQCSNYTNIYRKELKQKRDEKYVVNCFNCNQEWRYSRETKLIKALKKEPFTERFTCPYCGHKQFTYDEI